MQINGIKETDNETVFPVKSKQASATIAGFSTDVLCQRYSDRILVLITQLGKAGCLYQVSAPAMTSSVLQPSSYTAAPELADLNLPPPNPGATILSLLGSPPTEDDEAIYELYARQIAAIIHTEVMEGIYPEDVPPWAGRAVVVGLALKPLLAGQDDDAARRRQMASILRLVKEARVW